MFEMNGDGLVDSQSHYTWAPRGRWRHTGTDVEAHSEATIHTDPL